MGTVEIDDRGRITIPKELRERLHLEPGNKLDIEFADGEMRLHPRRDDLSTVTRGDEWGDEAFLDAGEATFGDG